MAVDCRLDVFKKMFEVQGLSSEAFQAFETAFLSYMSGETGTVSWADVEPMGQGDARPLEGMESDCFRRIGQSKLGEIVWIVLNGGLGTSMKMHRAKSLVPVKGKKTFLDLIISHASDLRKKFGHEIPLILMNSFATRKDSLDAAGASLSALAETTRGKLPGDFLQHRFPRIRLNDCMPLGKAEEKSSWAPPGHGNIYPALKSSGLLDKLTNNGYSWAFISNADNLGASIHEGLLGFLASNNIDFAMEVTKKTEADVKGGTLARIRGKLDLLEIAQTPLNHIDDFTQVGVFPVFNTNNIWVNLKSLKERLDKGPLNLPLIVNKKNIEGTEFVQLESAMGAAIGLFDKTAGILVPRNRFAPVKTSNDLLARRSDAYVVGESSPLVRNPLRNPELGPPIVRLDPEFYKSVEELNLKFPEPPSLLNAVSLDVEGDFVFGRGVSVKGKVRLVNPERQPKRIADGAVLEG